MVSVVLSFLGRLASKVHTDCPHGKLGYSVPKPPLPSKEELMHWQWLLRNKVLWEMRLTASPPQPNGVPAQLQCMEKAALAELMQDWVVSEALHGNLPSVRLSVLRTLQIPASNVPGLLQHACTDKACRDPTCLGNRIERLEECYKDGDEYYFMRPLLGEGWRALRCTQLPALPVLLRKQPPADEPAAMCRRESDSESSSDGATSESSDGVQTSSASSSSSSDEDAAAAGAERAAALVTQTLGQGQQQQAVSIADMFATAAHGYEGMQVLAGAECVDERASDSAASMQTANSTSFDTADSVQERPAATAAVPALNFVPLSTGVRKLRFVIVHHKCEDEWGGQAVSFILPFDLALVIALFLETAWPVLNLGLGCNMLLTKPHRELPLDDADMAIIWRRLQQQHFATWAPFPPSRLREATLGDTVGDLARAIARASPEEQAIVFGTSTVMTNTIRVWPHYIKQKVFNSLVNPCLEHLTRSRHKVWQGLAEKYYGSS